MSANNTAPRRVTINVQRFERIGLSDRYRVKIGETQIGLADMNHNGENYRVVRSLGRGRFIVRKEG